MDAGDEYYGDEVTSGLLAVEDDGEARAELARIAEVEPAIAEILRPRLVERVAPHRRVTAPRGDR